MKTTPPSSASEPAPQSALYDALLQEYAALHGDAVVHETGALHVDGINFYPLHVPELAPDSLQLWAEVLTVEPSRQAMIYRQMLSGNMHLHAHGLPVLSLCPETSRVVALARLSLSATTPAALHAAMQAVAPLVVEWRKNLPQQAFPEVSPPLPITGDKAGGQFHDLVAQYCALVGIDRPGLLVEGHPFHIDDVTFSLCYHAAMPGHFSVYGDVGKLPNSHIASTQAALLRMNTVFYMAHGMCLTVSPVQKDRAVCAFNLRLDGLSANDLLSTLESVVDMAEQWPTYMKTFFDGKPVNQGNRIKNRALSIRMPTSP